MKKLFTFFLLLVASIGTMFAWDYERVQIGDLYYNLDATNQTAEVTSQNRSYPYWSTTITTANIPASVTYSGTTYSVTSIGGSAFYDCSSLTSVTIPNSVTSIGVNAFRFCSSLTSVTIPNSVTSIGVSAFYGCSSLTSVTIGNSVTSIGDDAFSGCSSLTSVTIGNSVTSIGNYAFQNCSSLTSVTIPNSVTSIGERAFYNCSSLTSISVATDNPNYSSKDGVLFDKQQTKLVQYPGGKQGAYVIPNSVTSIGNSAFYNCGSLTSVTIPNSVTGIGNRAFGGCGSLTSVTIPNSVTSIGEWAFYFCSSLTSVTNYATIPQAINSYVFSNVDKSIPLYVPAESIDAYKSADQWSEFTNILPIPAASVAITANEDPEHAGTYYSTFFYGSGNYELPAAGVEAFVATISGSDMNLTRIAGGAGVIPQGTAVILRSTMASYNLTLRDDTPVFEGTNVLQGVDAATTTPANCYVLSAVDGVVGFYQYTGAQVGAHKAYLVYNGAGAPRRMRFVFDEENAVTGVEEARSETANAVRSEKCIENGQLIIEANGVRYNAQGQKVK